MRRIAALVIILATVMPLTAATGCNGCSNPEEEARERQAAAQAAEEEARREQLAKYKAAIEKVFHEDALTGQEPTVGHTKTMRSIDLSDSPEDFRVAYMKHIHAWDEEAEVHTVKLQLDSEEDSAALAGGLASIFGSDATPWSDHVQAEQELDKYQGIASADIKATFETLEEIASKYGAQVPH